jgi:prolipoprotein diacylglyceryltransferase
MHPVISKTFGGLSKPYYFRQLFFGLLFLAFIMFMLVRSAQSVSSGMVLMVAINTLLYPYARFVYESIAEPPRDLRRLIYRREWSHEQIQSIFP